MDTGVFFLPVGVYNLNKQINKRMRQLHIVDALETHSLQRGTIQARSTARQLEPGENITTQDAAVTH